jgi:signal transduction histidine kinase
MSDLPPAPDAALQGLLDALEEPAALVRESGTIYATNRAWLEPVAGLHAPGSGRDAGAALLDPDGSLEDEAKDELAQLWRGVIESGREEAITDLSIGPPNARLWFETRIRRVGRTEFFLLSHKDISRRVHAEEQLRLSRSRLRSVISGAPIVLLGLDTDGTFRVVEGVGASGLGATPELLIGRSVFEVYAHLPSLLDAVRGAMKGDTIAVSVPIGRLTIEIRFSPTIDRRGCVTGILGVATDITESTRIEEMKAEFVSVVSHELRTPLTSIRGSLGLLEGGVAGSLGDEAEELVRIARANSERLIRLINDILDLDKLEADRFEFHNMPLDPRQLLVQAGEELGAQASSKQITISVHGATSLPPVLGDADRLRQVLVNLTSNALKFAPRGSEVELRARLTPGERVRFEVVDHGPGISTSKRDRLFTKFQQLGTPSSTHSGGSGLGLAIAKAIIDAHSGLLDFESVEGKGTTFFFEIATVASLGTMQPPDSSRGRRSRTVELNVPHFED